MFQYSIETQEKKILPAVPILRNDLTSAQGISVRVLSAKAAHAEKGKQ